LRRKHRKTLGDTFLPQPVYYTHYRTTPVVTGHIGKVYAPV